MCVCEVPFSSFTLTILDMVAFSNLSTLEFAKHSVFGDLGRRFYCGREADSEQKCCVLKFIRLCVDVA